MVLRWICGIWAAGSYNPRVTTSSPTPPPPARSPTTPQAIHADRTARTLRIDWDDNHRSIYDFTALRWLCPCAFCRGEAGLPGWLDSAPTLTDDQTRMETIELVGNYAVAPTWGDGHHTGYYAFTMLRQRCPCEACSASRAAEPSPAQAENHQHREHQP